MNLVVAISVLYKNPSIACLIVVDIKPLLLLFEMCETILENQEKVNSFVVQSLAVNYLNMQITRVYTPLIGGNRNVSKNFHCITLF